MHVTLPSQRTIVVPLRQQSGLIVRTGLRGGVCVDVNDQVKAALKTLTDALGGTPVATAPLPATNTTPAPAS